MVDLRRNGELLSPREEEENHFRIHVKVRKNM